MGFRVRGSGFRVQGSGFRVQGSVSSECWKQNSTSGTHVDPFPTSGLYPSLAHSLSAVLTPTSIKFNRVLRLILVGRKPLSTCFVCVERQKWLVSTKINLRKRLNLIDVGVKVCQLPLPVGSTLAETFCTINMESSRIKHPTCRMPPRLSQSMSRFESFCVNSVST